LRAAAIAAAPLRWIAYARRMDDLYREVATALRRAENERAELQGEVRALKARLEQLVDVLVARGQLVEGHKRLFEKVGAAAVATGETRRVRLRQWVDKYSVPSAGIDCETRIPLCKARCCMLSFELTAQDLDEGVVRWELLEPYVIRHDADGYCTHLDRASSGCTIYDKRPAVCRGFDCRHDRRIWLDFEQRIPAP
jgi:hypothetical protein